MDDGVLRDKYDELRTEVSRIASRCIEASQKGEIPTDIVKDIVVLGLKNSPEFWSEDKYLIDKILGPSEN